MARPWSFSPHGLIMPAMETAHPESGAVYLTNTRCFVPSLNVCTMFSEHNSQISWLAAQASVDGKDRQRFLRSYHTNQGSRLDCLVAR